MISDLLATAEALARIDRTRPRQVSVRRAVSTAYYAVFHALAESNAELLVGRSTGQGTAFGRVYRALSHSQAKDVLRRPHFRSLDPNLAAFADLFVALQEARQEADYDPAPFPGSRQSVLDVVSLARRAIDHLRHVPTEIRLDLATHLLFKPRR